MIERSKPSSKKGEAKWVDALGPELYNRSLTSPLDVEALGPGIFSTVLIATQAVRR
jgi:hypothetical protein